MSSPALRKAKPPLVATVPRRIKPPPDAATEVIDLLRIAVDHLAAMRAMMEETTQAAQTPNNNDAVPLSDLIDDVLTVQKAAGIAGRDEKTIRRWHADFEIGVVIGGTLYIRKSKLDAHLAHTKRSVE